MTKRKRPTTLAEQADKHILYQRSVQDAAASRELMEHFFGARNARHPNALREDFCGTALLCAEWVQSHPQRTATGLDLDPPTLAWARAHNRPRDPQAAARWQVRRQNVLTPTAQTDFDIICAFNFSYSVFKQRTVMRQYFEAVHRALAPDSMFVLDLYGGPDAQFLLTEPRDVDDFEYVWEQARFDPINHHTLCHIHFRFADNSEMHEAFTYDWRHWTLPELKDILTEAGFRHIDVWWDGEEDDGYVIRESATNLESWIAYIAAWK
ncbi:MAG: class I SAM-dependent methyltransferase [Proteobacteria bacterium]|nr:class I SAM-dependent methyltransferase [Pseudomonadota bacterium]